jgi:hypothetical protein
MIWAVPQDIPTVEKRRHYSFVVPLQGIGMKFRKRFESLQEVSVGL